MPARRKLMTAPTGRTLDCWTKGHTSSSCRPRPGTSTPALREQSLPASFPPIHTPLLWLRVSSYQGAAAPAVAAILTRLHWEKRPQHLPTLSKRINRVRCIYKGHIPRRCQWQSRHTLPSHSNRRRTRWEHSWNCIRSRTKTRQCTVAGSTSSCRRRRTRSSTSQ